MLDTQKDMDLSVKEAESSLLARFMLIVAITRSEVSIQALTDLIAAGSVDDALNLISRSTPSLGPVWIKNFVASAGRVSNSIRGAIGAVGFDFDQTSYRTIQVMRENVDRLNRTYLLRQRAAAIEAANAAIRQGASPLGIATKIHGSIGLNLAGQRALENYRSSLMGEEDSPSRASRLASRTRRPLTRSQVDKMTGAYRGRLVRVRAKAASGLEAIRAVHEGAEATFGQAVDQGLINPNDLTRVWHTEQDNKVRSSHRAMNGQQRGYQELFVSGSGNRLRFPTDPRAPIEDIIHCRCVVSHTLQQ